MPTTTATPPLVRCPACGATNRIDPARVASGVAPVCGRCRSPLPQPTSAGQVLVVTDATFPAEVERSPLPVLLDVWAPWCGPCRMLAPAIEELAADLAGRVRVAKLNSDDNPRTAARYRVDALPTLLTFRDGREIARLVGLHPKRDIGQWLENLLA